MANNNDGQIVLGLDIPKTVSQINADIKKLEKQLAQVKATGALDTSATVKQINSQIASLQAQLKTININANVDTNNAQKAGQKIGQTVADTAQKAIDGKKINVDKLNADVKTLTNSLNKFSSKNAGFDTFQTDINGVEVSLDSLIQKLSTVDNNTDLSTIRSQVNALKSAFTELQEVNRIQLSTDITKIENDYKRFGIVSQEVENNLKELKIARENALKAEGTDRASAEIEKYNQKLAETKSSWKELQATQVSANQRTSQMTAMQEWMRKNKNATKLCGDQVQKLIQECQTCDKVRFDQIKNEFKELQVEAGKAGKLGNTPLGSLIEQGKGFIQWTGVSGVVMGTVNSIRKLIATSKEFDGVMTDFTMATGSTENQLKSLTKTYNKLADDLKSTTDVMTSATEWIKQGQSIADTETLITNSMILSKIGKLNSADATKYLTSAMKGYKVSVDDTLGVVDKLSAVDMASATDVGGLAEGMSEVAASADLAGVSMDKLLGYLAAIGETTQSGMGEVGTTLNAVFSRMGNIKLARLKDYDNNGEDLSNVETVLRGVGITLRDSTNSFRDFDEVLDETASNWSNYSEVQQRAIASAFAGTHHMNEFIVLMENYDKALQYTETSLNSSGEAMEKFSAYEKSVEAHTQSFTNAVQGLADTAVDSGLINFFIDLGTTGIKALDGLMEAITPLGTIGLISGGILGGKNLGKFA